MRPNEYPALLAPLLAGTADVVYGSRFAEYPLFRIFRDWHYFGNWLLTAVSNMFTGWASPTWRRATRFLPRTPLPRSLPDLRSNRFGFEPEVTAIVAKNNFRVTRDRHFIFRRAHLRRGEKDKLERRRFRFWTMFRSWWRFSTYGKVSVVAPACFGGLHNCRASSDHQRG